MINDHVFISTVMAVMKQKNLRQAEKTLREMLDRADTRGEGKVDMGEFIKILESNNVQVNRLGILYSSHIHSSYKTGFYKV